ARGNITELRKDAAALYEEGITVSVVGTGEGSAAELRSIAEAGRGRFYPGRDLARIPEILVQESVIASRSFINEGEFFPTITAGSTITDPIESTPPLFGFVATTAKPSARTLMVIGEEQDPLLATWQVGLGRATSWTSDAELRWTQAWPDWDGYVSFWSRLVRDSFPIDSGGSVRATIDGDQLEVRVEVPTGSADDIAGGDAGSGSGAGPSSAGPGSGPDGAGPDGAVTVTVTDPDGVQRNVELTSSGDGVFVGTAAVAAAGSYAVGAGLVNTEGTTALGSDLATLSYAAEYLPGEANEALLASLSEATGGRGPIGFDQAFDGESLRSSSRTVSLAGWLLAIGIAAWLASLVFSRLWIAGTVPQVSSVPAPLGQLGRLARRRRRSPSKQDRASPTDPPAAAAGARPVGVPGASPAGTPAVGAEVPTPPPDPDGPEESPSSMDELLKAKRDRR
ncbi:MAG: glutamine amidotransferase, partial [Acidimicrobiales bacterium]